MGRTRDKGGPVAIGLGAVAPDTRGRGVVARAVDVVLCRGFAPVGCSGDGESEVTSCGDRVGDEHCFVAGEDGLANGDVFGAFVYGDERSGPVDTVWVVGVGF